MKYMFNKASKFNGSINNWTPSNVTDMQYMFYDAIKFNQNIGNWDVSKVVNMEGMFGCYAVNLAFNQDIGSWDVGNVVNMSKMFNGSIKFNQDLDSWNVSNVIDMYGMFFNASAFNHSLENWNLKSILNVSNMLNNCGMDCINYGKTLVGWASNTNTPKSKYLGASGLKYSQAAYEYRNILTTTLKWTISDAGKGTCASEWTGTIDRNWTNASNWSPSTVPLSGDDIVFSPTANNDLVLDGNKTIGLVDFNGSSKKIILNSYTLTAFGFGSYNENSYVEHKNNSGKIIIEIPNNHSRVFASGMFGANYSPVTITNKTSENDTFTLTLLDDAYLNGYSGTKVGIAHVQRVWHIHKKIQIRDWE